MTIQSQRTALVTTLMSKINAAAVAPMTANQLLEQSALHLMLDKVLASDPMVADAMALLGAVSAAELSAILEEEDGWAAYQALVSDAGKRWEIVANANARAAIAGSYHAVSYLSTVASDAFDHFLSIEAMRSALFGSSMARLAILGTATLRGWLLGTPTAANLTYALDDANMRAAMFADATTRAEMLASSALMDAANLTYALDDANMRAAMFADATTRAEMLASSALMDAVWANATARDAAFNDATMRAAVIASTNAFTRLIANATARQAAWGNANMAAAMAGSATALGVIDDTQAHMDEVLSSTYSTMRALMISDATARGAIVASAAWMKRAANVAGFLPLALADGAFLTAWRASSALTARELPTMTTTDANMTASSESSASWAAWKAADSDTTSEWLASSAPPGWLKYDFGSGKSVNVHQIVLQAGNNRKPNAWTLEGSNDNSAWTSVATGNMVNNTSQQLFNVAHSAGYRYFRWTVSSVHFGGTPGIADFDLKGFEVQ